MSSERKERRQLLTISNLRKIKTNALRRRVWFKALSKVERAVFDLTVKCVEQIRSTKLERALWDIACKIFEAMEKTFLKTAEKTGRQIAQKLSKIAQKWGNQTAPDWERDKQFIIYLGVNTLNLGN
jgi:uncharacterized membrane-anchored protein YjiN (DUF445 family)